MDIREIEKVMFESVDSGDKVKITLKGGGELTGYTGWFSNRWDNESGFAEFAVEIDGEDVYVESDEIETIEIVD